MKLTEEKRYWNVCLRLFLAEVRLSVLGKFAQIYVQFFDNFTKFYLLKEQEKARALKGIFLVRNSLSGYTIHH